MSFRQYIQPSFVLFLLLQLFASAAFAQGFKATLTGAQIVAVSRVGTYNQARDEMRELQFALRINF